MKPAILIIFAVLAPCVSSAQEPRVTGLRPAGMPTVFVTDDRGVETRGKLLRLDDEAVVVMVGAEQRRFETARVARVEKRGDSLKNGAIAGAAFGALMGALGAVISDCGRDGCAAYRVAIVPLSSLFYAAIGTGIDAVVEGRTLVYKRPAVHVAASSTGAAVTLRLSW